MKISRGKAPASWSLKRGEAALTRKSTKPHRRGELPSAAVARAAVNAACVVTGADPNHVIDAWPVFHHRTEQHMAIARARLYAAFALRAIFEDGKPGGIARSVGVTTHVNHYMSARDTAMREGRLRKWWSDRHFMRVIEATEAFIAMTTREQKEKLEAAE